MEKVQNLKSGSTAPSSKTFRDEVLFLFPVIPVSPSVPLPLILVY
jgi:hypothetical protein